MKANEIIEKIEVLAEKDEDLYISEIGYTFKEDEWAKELGKVVCIEEKEFTNGDAWKIYKFEDHDVYLRLNGYYCSYESYSQFEELDFTEVFPVEETRTIYVDEIVESK